MTYYIGQVVGILATVGCLALPLFKKKWQMLVALIAVNGLLALNLLLLGRISSGIIVNLLAVVQAGVTLWRVLRGKDTPVWENVLFLVLYVAGGALGFKTLIDMLPIIGAVFNMLSTFQRNEQKSRFLLMLNAVAFASYYAILGSTSALAEAGVVVTSILAMIRYRKKQTA